jgi:NitT/TauT family transport system substrate-binding protein
MRTSHLNIKKICLFLLAIALLLLLAACTGAAAKPEHPPLKVGWSLWPGFYPIVIAAERDLFAKHGVAVEPIFYELYAAQLPDLQASKLDGVPITLGDALLLEGRASDSIRAVIITDHSTGADSIIATADIKTPADLKGKTIGVGLGSFGELLVRNMLQVEGLTIEDVTLININPEETTAAMPETIQAGHIWEPFTSEALAQGHHIIFSSAETPGLISDVIVFRTEIVEERPEEVRAFVAAWFEALAWWQTHPEEGNAMIAKHTGLKPEEISTEGIRLLNLDDNLRAFAPGSDPTSLHVSGQVNADFLISAGGLTSAPDVERLLEPSFLK